MQWSMMISYCHPLWYQPFSYDVGFVVGLVFGLAVAVVVAVVVYLILCSWMEVLEQDKQRDQHPSLMGLDESMVGKPCHRVVVLYYESHRSDNLLDE